MTFMFLRTPDTFNDHTKSCGCNGRLQTWRHCTTITCSCFERANNPKSKLTLSKIFSQMQNSITYIHLCTTKCNYIIIVFSALACSVNISSSKNFSDKITAEKCTLIKFKQIQRNTLSKKDGREFLKEKKRASAAASSDLINKNERRVT